MSVRNRWQLEPVRKQKKSKGIKVRYDCPSCGAMGGGYYERIPRRCRVCGAELKITVEGGDP